MVIRIGEAAACNYDSWGSQKTANGWLCHLGELVVDESTDGESMDGGVKPPLHDRSEDRPLHKKEKRSPPFRKQRERVGHPDYENRAGRPPWL